MRGLRVVILGLAFLLFATGAVAAPLLYVADRGAWNVVVMDLEGNLVNSIPLTPPYGATPYGISITPDGTKAYTANWQNLTCSAISLADNTVVGITEGVGAYAQHIAITPDGKRGYVATDWYISVIDTATDTVIDWIPLVGVSYTTLSPDGNWLFATCDFNNPSGGSIAKINTATGGIEAQIQYTAQLTSAVVSPDGARLYVSSQSDNRIYIFSTDDYLNWLGYVEAAHGLRMLLSKDGTRLYVTNNTGNLVQVIDTGTNKVINEIPITGPVGLALSPDEGRLFVSYNSGEASGGVAVVDLTLDTPSITKYLGGFTLPKEIAILAGPEVPEVLEVLKVAIDIKPGSDRNPINLKNKGKVWVAILSDATFNAATVDPSTVVFAGASPLSRRHKGLCVKLEDVNGDGLLDMVLHFKTQDLTLQPGAAEACLTGQTFEPVQAFTGCDSVRTIKWKEQKQEQKPRK